MTHHDYNSITMWAASFPFSSAPTRRSVHVRMRQEMQHQLLEAARLMQQRGITRYKLSMEWTPRLLGDEAVYWLNIDIEYDDRDEQQQEENND